MIYLDSNSSNANYNFALEAYAMHELDIADSYFMFWRTQPTLMIGQYQNALQEINLDYVEDNNINVVRRVTGGGTIYTDLGGWQFSYIFKDTKDQDIIFQKFTEPIIAALKHIGIDACHSGRNDLLIDGKKFSGNAQYIRGNLLLHHGSLLFNTDLDNLVKALSVNDEKLISKGIKSVRQRVTNIADYLDKEMTSLEFRELMLEYLTKDMQRYTLTEEDDRRINRIKASQFDSWDWNFGKTPEFTFSREKRFQGGKLVVQALVKGGIIEDVNFYGDFFAKGNLSQLQNALRGCRYEYAAVERSLGKSRADDYFYNITKENILELLI